MAEKAPPRKRPTAPARQQMLEALSETEKQVSQRKEADARPEEKLEAKSGAELESAGARAAAEAGKRVQQESAASQELQKREFAGERNVLTTRIAALEQTVKEQAEQLGKLSQQPERAHGQMQEIAVRAIEGSSGAKSLANLQQLLADQGRKPAER